MKLFAATLACVVAVAVKADDKMDCAKAVQTGATSLVDSAESCKDGSDELKKYQDQCTQTDKSAKADCKLAQTYACHADNNNDAKDIHALLKNNGFRSTLLVDATCADMQQATHNLLSELKQRIAKAAETDTHTHTHTQSPPVVCVFFAGHGADMGGRAQLLAVDEPRGIDVRTLLTDIHTAGGGEGVHVVLLTDACRMVRADTHTHARTTTPHEWAEVVGVPHATPPSFHTLTHTTHTRAAGGRGGFFLGCACPPGVVCVETQHQDGDTGDTRNAETRNGVFARALLAHLPVTRPDSGVVRAFHHVHRSVQQWTQYTQLPWCVGDTHTDIVVCELQPLLLLNVDITGEGDERPLRFFHGEDPCELAKKFCENHGLDSEQIPMLALMIWQNLENQNLQDAIRHGAKKPVENAVSESQKIALGTFAESECRAAGYTVRDKGATVYGSNDDRNLAVSAGAAQVGQKVTWQLEFVNPCGYSGCAWFGVTKDLPEGATYTEPDSILFNRNGVNEQRSTGMFACSNGGGVIRDKHTLFLETDTVSGKNIVRLVRVTDTGDTVVSVEHEIPADWGGYRLAFLATYDMGVKVVSVS